MDITLVRQAELEKSSNKVKSINISGIFDLSRSSLRILYECGMRPLYVFEHQDSNNPVISIKYNPQPKPDCILCGKDKNEIQSATVLKKQFMDIGMDIPIIESSWLSESQSQDAVKENLSARLIQKRLQSLAKGHHKHIIIVSSQQKLDNIYKAITHKNLPVQNDGCVPALWSIQNNQLAYIYDPKLVNHVTDGILDTILVSKINKPDCPKYLKKFHGKVKKPIEDYVLLNELKKESIQK